MLALFAVIVLLLLFSRHGQLPHSCMTQQVNLNHVGRWGVGINAYGFPTGFT